MHSLVSIGAVIFTIGSSRDALQTMLINAICSILKFANNCEVSQFIDINVRGVSSIVYNLVYTVRNQQGDRRILWDIRS